MRKDLSKELLTIDGRMMPISRNLEKNVECGSDFQRTRRLPLNQRPYAAKQTENRK